MDGIAGGAERPVRFSAAGRPPLMLEGILTRHLEQDDVGLHAVAVLCHPQPLSSSMADPLLVQLSGNLAASGIVNLRFNFRGVGESEGQQTDGRLEPLDIAGAIDFVLSQPGVNAEKLCLIGHAFGAYVALAYAEHDMRVRTVIAISPPIFRIAPELAKFDRPRLFVTGEYDEVAPRHKLEPWIEQLPGARALRVVTGARHLMRGYETVASATVVQYVARWASAPGV